MVPLQSLQGHGVRGQPSGSARIGRTARGGAVLDTCAPERRYRGNRAPVQATQTHFLASPEARVHLGVTVTPTTSISAAFAALTCFCGSSQEVVHVWLQRPPTALWLLPGVFFLAQCPLVTPADEATGHTSPTCPYGLSPVVHSVPRPPAGSPSGREGSVVWLFPVFVDSDCSNQHQRPDTF